MRKITSILLCLLMVIGITPIKANATTIPDEAKQVLLNKLENGHGDGQYMRDAFNGLLKSAQNYLIAHIVDNYRYVWMDSHFTEPAEFAPDFKAYSTYLMFSNTLVENPNPTDPALVAENYIQVQVNYEGTTMSSASIQSAFPLDSFFNTDREFYLSSTSSVQPIKFNGQMKIDYTPPTAEDINIQLKRSTINGIDYKDAMADIKSRLNHDKASSFITGYISGNMLNFSHLYADHPLEYTSNSFGPYNLAGFIVSPEFFEDPSKVIGRTRYSYNLESGELTKIGNSDTYFQSDYMYKDYSKQSNNEIHEIYKLNHRGNYFGTIKPKPVARNTINISANVEPYLETSLSATTVDLNPTALEDVNSAISMNVKSNLNYKVESKFTGLSNADATTTLGADKFNLGLDTVNKPLTVNEFVSIADNQTLGDTNYALDLKLKSSNVIKSDTYTGTLELKVSQL